MIHMSFWTHADRPIIVFGNCYRIIKIFFVYIYYHHCYYFHDSKHINIFQQGKWKGIFCQITGAQQPIRKSHSSTMQSEHIPK